MEFLIRLFTPRELRREHIYFVRATYRSKVVPHIGEEEVMIFLRRKEPMIGSRYDRPRVKNAIMEELGAQEHEVQIVIESINYLGFHHIPPGAEMKAEIEEAA